MNERQRILFVDDEVELLKLYRAQLQQFDVVVAQSGEEALPLIDDKDPFAVVVSDLHMPAMNGAQLLARVRKIAPSSVRMLMTGETDLGATLDAINDGNLFRFLTKPCATEAFRKAIVAGIEQHRLLIAEKELLEKTLLGSIQVLTEILSLVSPMSFGKSTRIRRMAQQLGTALQFPNPWILDVSVMLSQIGCVTVPDMILNKIHANAGLNNEERAIYETHPKIGSQLVAKIPRLEEVAEIILHQSRRFDSSCSSTQPVSTIPLGAQILHVVFDFEELESSGLPRNAAISRLLEKAGCYNMEVLAALQHLPLDESSYSRENILIQHLQVEMVLAEDLKNKSGALLAPRGQSISDALLRRLINNADNGNLSGRVQVLVPHRMMASVQRE